MLNIIDKSSLTCYTLDRWFIELKARPRNRGRLNMHILVIDDQKRNQESAQEQLGSEHELTITGSYSEALRMLHNIQEKHRQGFDVVLTDDMMPAVEIDVSNSRRPTCFWATQHEKMLGIEVAVGIGIAQLASLVGAKYCGVVTATNHHDHPNAVIFDLISDKHARHPAPLFKINDTVVGYYATFVKEGEGKNWKKVLDSLLSGIKERTACRIDWRLLSGRRELIPSSTLV